MTYPSYALLALILFLSGACSTTNDKAKTSADSTPTGYEISPDIATSAPAVPRPGPQVERLLQGTWQRVSDPNDTFAISGSKRINTYAGQQALTLDFTYVADCTGSACENQESHFGCFTTAGTFDIDCQSIVTISTTDLEITQGATGDTSRYRKRQ